MNQNCKRSEWEQRIAECANSGQTIATWCETNNIKLCNFYYWKRRLRDQEEEALNQPIKWLSLDLRPTVADQPEHKMGTVTVEIGQARVIAAPGFDQRVFRDIVNILQTL